MTESLVNVLETHCAGRLLLSWLLASMALFAHAHILVYSLATAIKRASFTTYVSLRVVAVLQNTIVEEADTGVMYSRGLIPHLELLLGFISFF